MAIITISRGSYSKGREIAEKTAERLGYGCIGRDVIIDATGNMRKWRELARSLIPRYAEVYLKCSLEECAQRERSRRETRGAPKDIYLKGKKGWPVPGVNAPYEEPLNPEIAIECGTSVKDAVATINVFVTNKLLSL